ncbi:MAG: ABC transporter ATP-binding protein [Synechococcales cyanobacterium C42_A2020_086]|jgi:ATP-binding cassette subfamily B protein|nr:ABC transporter ATP-binding protein [Synechococcales cyanobacterium C42_A2020_086]
MHPKPLSSAQALRRSLAMVVQAAPRELRNITLLNLVTGIGPSVSLVFSKIVIDEASRLLAQGEIESPAALMLNEPKLLGSLVVSIVLGLMVDSLNAIDVALFGALRDRVQGYVQGQVLHKVAHFNDIALFETPELLNLLELTEKGIQRLQRFSFIVAASMMGLFTFVPSVLLSASITWWVPLVLLSASVPSVFVEIRHHRKSWRVEETQAGITREMDIYAKVLTGEAYAKEVRLFSLQTILLQRWQGLFGRMFGTMEQVRREGSLSVMLWAVIGGLGSAVPYVYVVMGVLQGIYTLGDLALFTGIILQVRRSLYLLIGNGGDIYDVALATIPIFQLLDLEPELHSGSRSLPAANSSFEVSGIQLRNLCFAYPGSSTQILSNINLTIRPGEMVALVGENGAGKTTLAKLLCRLYDPQRGSINWHGHDLRSLDLGELRSRIGVVMQDYARFPATVRENVGWGYMPNLSNDRAIHGVLADAGIDHVIAELAEGLETPLGKQLEGGIDLSGGQWQRIAIARALMRLSEVELLVFDEPTAALDPKNEQEIYRIFQTIARGRMTVIVSHRLALAKLADRIVVLEHGEILETGTHNELMIQGGRYHTMFTRQASSYL